MCNAAETLLIDRAIAPAFVPRLVARLGDRVELRGDDTVRVLGGDRVKPATDDDWAAEYLDLILATCARRRADLDAAVAHIERYGSDHTESIVTTDADAAERFVRQVDSSTVIINASTRFADGGAGARPRRRDRHLDDAPPRLRADGRRRSDDDEVRDSRNRTSPHVAKGNG